MSGKRPISMPSNIQPRKAATRGRGAALEQEAAVPDARALKGPRVVLLLVELHHVRHPQLAQDLGVVGGRELPRPARGVVGV